MHEQHESFKKRLLEVSAHKIFVFYGQKFARLLIVSSLQFGSTLHARNLSHGHTLYFISLAHTYSLNIYETHIESCLDFCQGLLPTLPGIQSMKNPYCSAFTLPFSLCSPSFLLPLSLLQNPMLFGICYISDCNFSFNRHLSDCGFIIFYSCFSFFFVTKAKKNTQSVMMQYIFQRTTVSVTIPYGISLTIAIFNTYALLPLHPQSILCSCVLSHTLWKKALFKKLHNLTNENS